MTERCGDRQRKFDGLEKWKFRWFVESLPIMLQIALLLLAGGLSRYMWAVNTSVAYVIISLAALGLIFYVGIAAAGASSYECPFQTPVSIGLRALRSDERTKRILASLSLPRIIWSVRVTWGSARSRLASQSRHVHDTVKGVPSWDVSLSSIESGVRVRARTFGHQVIIVIFRAGRALGNAKYGLLKRVQKYKSRLLLPLSVADASTPRRSGLLSIPGNLATLRRRNADDARCVSWILRNITDPEAIASAVRLAGSIRWFDGDVDVDPPYDFFVSIFETSVGINRKLCPGMRDRAYFAGRAVLRMTTCAKLHSRESASRYPIPQYFIQDIDGDLGSLISVLRCWSSDPLDCSHVPRQESTPEHTLWMSNLLLDLIRANCKNRTPPLPNFPLFLTRRLGTSNISADVNILLAWCVFLGETIEEDAFWVNEKSYVVVLSLFSPLTIAFVSDLLKKVLSRLSNVIAGAISRPSRFWDVHDLLKELVAWEGRPAYLTTMAYEWCSAICEKFGQLKDQVEDHELLEIWKQRSSQPLAIVVSECCPMSPPKTRDHYLDCYRDLLFLSLKIGFRKTIPIDCRLKGAPLVHTRHHERMIDLVFVNEDVELIADALCAWTTEKPFPSLASCVPHLVGLADRGVDFSSRLQRTVMHTIWSMKNEEWERAGLAGLARVLDRISVEPDEVRDGNGWKSVLKAVVHSPEGRKHLSIRYWHLLETLARSGDWEVMCDSCVGVMRSLEETQEWEKLEAWACVVWLSPSSLHPVPIDEVLAATLALFQQRSSAITRLEGSSEPTDSRCLRSEYSAEFKRICDQARATRPTPEPSL
jgi:hypothetical protein